MLAEILRRLVATIPVMVVVALAVFALLHVTPGDPAAPRSARRIASTMGGAPLTLTASAQMRNEAQ